MYYIYIIGKRGLNKTDCGTDVENPPLSQRAKKGKKAHFSCLFPAGDLTEPEQIVYTFTVQGCPLSKQRTPRRKDYNSPRVEGQSFGGKKYEKNLSAQEAPAFSCAWLPEPYEQQQRPQGHPRSSCQGPRQTGCLIFLHYVCAARLCRAAPRKGHFFRWPYFSI